MTPLIQKTPKRPKLPTKPLRWEDIQFTPVPGQSSALEEELKTMAEKSWLPPQTKAADQKLMESLWRVRSAEDAKWLLLEAKCVDWNGLEKAAELFCDRISQECKTVPSVSLKVQSFSSKLYHEGAIEERVVRVLTKRGLEDKGEAALHTLWEIKKDRLRVSVSLTGQRMGQRAYKDSVGFQAPLREEQAAACFLRSHSLKSNQESASCPSFGSFFQASKALFLVPFAGSGTLGFEGLLWKLEVNIPSPQIEKTCSLFHWWSPKTWSYLASKQAKSLEAKLSALEKVQILFLESSSEAEKSLQKHIESFQNSLLRVCVPSADPLLLEPLRAMFQSKIQIQSVCVDFFQWTANEKTQVDFQNSAICVPLNPPFGVRLGSGDSQGAKLYDRISKHVQDVWKVSENPGCGFVLCPQDAHWSTFQKNIKGHTFHFMQGGMDMRVLVFSLAN